MEKAILWLGTLDDRDRYPNVVWQFRPIVTATIDGVSTALGASAHVLELARLKWSSSRPIGARQADSHLEQAVRAARHFLSGDPPRTPSRRDIASFIAQEEDFSGETNESLNTLKARWRRAGRRPGGKPITLTEVLSIASREYAP